MKVICGLFGFIFGLTGFSCFYNLAIGRHPSPPLVLFLLGIVSIAITALCVYGFITASEKAKATGSSVIVKTKIIDTLGKKSTSSAAVRGAVGGAVAGGVGAIVGASTAKENRSTTFLILYKNGKRMTRTVPNGSLEYQKYVKYLDM